MIATMIKQGRQAKGLTQKELAEQTNISVRSIQRIENAALLPRSYTLKTIAGVLDIPFADLVATENDTATEPAEHPSVNKLPRKIIFSVFIPVLGVLAGLAFISQSAKFPETNFETFIFWAMICLVVAIALYIIWHPLKKNE